MKALFWLSAALVAYVYAGYPLLLAVWARLAPAPGLREPRGADPYPDVSIVIAARNEAARLPARIRNLLALDYPARQRQIIVVSDGSTDDTEDVLAPFAPDVEVVSISARGKAAALNAGVARARFDVLLFADARQIFDADAIRALTAPFGDSRVGGVTGELILGCEAAGRRDGEDRRSGESDPSPGSDDRRSACERRAHFKSTVADAVGLYWRYEKAIRQLESSVGSMLGATGAIYALRREFWQPLPEGTLLDDVLAPMRAVLAGKRIVFEPRARAFDVTPADSSAEAGRKLRTLAGNFQMLWLEPRVLVPFVNPVWLQYVSHKLGRLVVPYGLLGLITASIALAGTHPFYAAALAAQCAMYILGGYGAWLEFEAAPVTMPAVVKESHSANA